MCSQVDFVPDECVPKSLVTILDTNICLHYLEALAHPALKNLVVLQTVLNEVAANNSKSAERVREIIGVAEKTSMVFCNENYAATYAEQVAHEIVNDRNDRAIRKAAAWYSHHLEKYGATVVLLTNDKENGRLAKEAGIAAFTIQEYVSLFFKNERELAEQVAVAQDFSMGDAFDQYQPYLSREELNRGLSSGRFFSSKFRTNKKFWGEGWVNCDGEEVHIGGSANVNRSFDGDVVVVEKILPEKMTFSKINIDNEGDVAPADFFESEDIIPVSKQEGKVVGVLQRNWRSYCGSLQETNIQQGHVLFVSIDERFPKIRIYSRQIQELMDKRIMVNVDSWPENSKYPIGHYVRTVGRIGDRNAETEVIMLEHGVTEAIWSNAVLNCLPPADYKIDAEELAKRVDLRNEHVLSIDPVGCKDIDDALHCKVLPNGNFEVGVHIADVSHYIAPDSALDFEAAERSTSVYLVERRIDMLPDLLSTNMCSLIANADRLTFSVTWEMTPDAKVIGTKFFKSIIHSKAAMAYKDAQKFIDQNDVNHVHGKPVIHLNNLAKKLKQERIGRGSLMLASPAVKFMMDSASAIPNDVELYELTESHALVEEFMLLANISVARFITDSFPQYGLLRRHPTPAPHFFDNLLKAAGSIGLDIQISNSKALAESLERAHIPEYPYFNTLLRILTTRCMTQAVYFCSGELNPSDYYHYGLAAPIYTHFTSPIRRYADIIVHRLLAAALEIAPLPQAIENRDRMTKVAEVMNNRHRMAQLCGRASVNLHTLIFFRDKVVVTDAVIMNIRSNTIYVLVQKYGMEVPIKFGDKTDDWSFDDATLTLSLPNFTFQVFDQLKVKIYVQQLKHHRQKLVVEVVERRAANAGKSLENLASVPDPELNFDVLGKEEKENVGMEVADEDINAIIQKRQKTK